jgi:hypothetical protein
MDSAHERVRKLVSPLRARLGPEREASSVVTATQVKCGIDELSIGCKR